MRARIGILAGVFVVGLIIVACGAYYFLFASSSGADCNVAYVQLEGDLVTYVPASDQGSSTAQDETGSDDVTAQIREADADPDMRAIVLEIDSPGGDPVAGNEIESALKLARKPTVALIRSEGDSAAYLAASGADTIFANEFSDVGDIGITESYTDQSKQDQANGITFDQLSVGQYKDMFNSDKPLTEAERTLAMSQLQLLYRDFVQIVAQNRSLSSSTALSLANGSGFPAQEALQDGLIDSIGTVDDVRAFLTKKIGTQAVICGIDD